VIGRRARFLEEFTFPRRQAPAEPFKRSISAFRTRWDPWAEMDLDAASWFPTFVWTGLQGAPYSCAIAEYKCKTVVK